MNKDTLAISDFYKKNINPTFILQESFSDVYRNNTIAELQEWYDHDVEVLNQILVQEGLGDMIKNVGQKIGGAVKGIGNFALKQLATALGKALKMAMPSEEEAQKLVQGVEKLKTDKNYQEQQATAGGKLLGTGGSSESSEEMYENTRHFLLSTVFSESNLIKLFNTQLILSEAKVGRPKGSKEGKGGKAKSPAKPAGKVNVAGGVQKANMAALDPAIMELISVVQQMKGGRQKQALNRIARVIANKTKLQFPIPYPKADKQTPQGGGDQGQGVSQDNQLATTQQAGQLATTQQGGQLATQNNQLATNQDSQLATPQGGELGRRRRSQPNIVDAEYTDVPNDKELPSSGGDTKSLFQKVISYVKAHPRITSTIAIGLIAAVTAASGGSLLPLVISGLTTGGVKAGVSAYQTNKEEGKVNWDKTVDSLFKGTAAGVGAAAVGQGLKGLMGDVPSTESGIKPIQAQAGNASGINNWDGDSGTQDNGLGWDGEPKNQDNGLGWDGEPKNTAGITNDQFKQYNASQFNPKSPLDQAKKQIMQKLSSSNNGQIPSDQYNDLARKAAQLIKKGAKPNSVVAQLLPESYTASYLRYF
jgi:hypothetical protein